MTFSCLKYAHQKSKASGSSQEKGERGNVSLVFVNASSVAEGEPNVLAVAPVRALHPALFASPRFPDYTYCHVTSLGILYAHYLCALAYAAFVSFLFFSFLFFSSLIFLVFSFPSFSLLFFSFLMDSSGLTPAWLSLLGCVGGFWCSELHRESCSFSLSHAHSSRATSKTSVSTRSLYSALIFLSL